jgi:ABC-type lipoprotein export system ATPase subunit
MNEPSAARPGNALVSAQRVAKSYRMGERTLSVLRDLDFSIAPGEFVALQGASGAGKSTLLHLLGGLDSADAGEIWFNGKDLARFSSADLAKLRNVRVGFVFQAFHLIPELSALENVSLPARIARVSAEEATTRGRELLERVGLRERTDHRPYELSGGERQRVALARALVNQPDLILADEPTGNLDSHTGGEIMDLLCSLVAERKATLIVATHDASVANRAPKVVRLADGRIQP